MLTAGIVVVFCAEISAAQAIKKFKASKRLTVFLVVIILIFVKVDIFTETFGEGKDFRSECQEEFRVHAAPS